VGTIALALRDRAGGDTLLAVGMVGLLAVLVVPLPQSMLDLLLTANLSFALLILVSALSAKEPLEFSSFPSILLFTTLSRLALNVASSRLILLEGEAGGVITAFGNFVVGGNLLVGGVVFLILVVVQFVVITKGAGRVSEVAARFTLDALPGKQMAIDADLNAGLIDESTARERRERIAREAEFHGAMDGASKFVRGDAIAGLLITGINLVIGFLAGLLDGLSAIEALHRYAILTVGDGLVSQIPALLIATAAGTLVVKSSSNVSLSEDLTLELLDKPSVLPTVASMLLVLGLLPGMPFLPFFAIAAGAIGVSRLRAGQPTREERQEAEEAAAAAAAEPAEPDVYSLLQVDRVALELGFGLVAMADSERGGTVIERIKILRNQIARDLGWVVPPIRVRENLELEAKTYRLLLGGDEVATGTLEPTLNLALGEDNGAPLRGVPTLDPSFGLPATWIDEDQRVEAELGGYTVVDPTTVLITHLGEVLRRNASDVISRDDVKRLLEDQKERAPALIEELWPNLLTTGEVQRVLAELLQEEVSIRNLPAILAGLADTAAVDKTPQLLVGAARQRVARAVCTPHLDPQGTLRVLTLDPRVERELIEGLGEGLLRRLIDALRRESERATAQAGGRAPVLVVQNGLRQRLAELLRQSLPHLRVVAFSELSGAARVESVGLVRLEETS